MTRQEMVKLLRQAQEVAFEHSPELWAAIENALDTERTPQIDWTNAALTEGKVGKFQVRVRAFGEGFLPAHGSYTYELYTGGIKDSREAAVEAVMSAISDIREGQ